MLHWNCPHCGIKLIVSQEYLGTGWSFSRCAQCTGYCLIRRTEINVIRVDKAPPGEKIIPSHIEPQHPHPHPYPHPYPHRTSQTQLNTHQTLHLPLPYPQNQASTLYASGATETCLSPTPQPLKTDTTQEASPQRVASSPSSLTQQSNPFDSSAAKGSELHSPSTAPPQTSSRSVSQIAHELQEKTKNIPQPPPPPNTSSHPHQQRGLCSQPDLAPLNEHSLTSVPRPTQSDESESNPILQTPLQPLSETTLSISGAALPELQSVASHPAQLPTQRSPLLFSGALAILIAGGYIIATQKQLDWRSDQESVIVSDQVKETALAPIPNQDPSADQQHIETQAELVHTYSGPGLNFPVIYELAPHSTYKVLEVHESWVKINLEHLSNSLNIKSGWVPTEKIKVKSNHSES